MEAARQDIERMIADELRSHHQATDPWVRAMAETGGDFDKARKRYRELRLAQLCAARDGDGLRRLRHELRYETGRHGKATIYSVIGLEADAEEGEVAAAIAQIIVSGTSLDAESRYAVEVLGDEARRAEYDRHLLQQLRGMKPAAAANHAEQRAVPRSPVARQRSARDVWLALGAVLVGLTYFGTEHYRDMRREEIQQEVAARRAALDRMQAKTLGSPSQTPGTDTAGLLPTAQAGQ